MIYLILLILSFLFSIYFSASETAFSALNRAKIRLWSKSGKTGAASIEKYIKDPDKFLIPILIGNNYANILYTFAIVQVLTEFEIKSFSHVTVTLVQSLVLVLFAEIIPKVIAKNTADKFIFAVIFPFLFFNFICPLLLS